MKEYSLRSRQTPYGWIGFQGDRRCRELAREGVLERRYVDGYAEYRYRGQVARQELTREEILRIAIS